MNFRAKPIMIQGTMSNVGKSLITAALCRILSRAGFRVAPFKSQNMALNSFVTHDGFEIGRAQAMQAEAAGKEADVRMNPILLKPLGDSVSQVILNGEPYCNMKASDYFATKEKFIPNILHAYESLAAENDAIIVEGAGSPAEINLNSHDIVNMGLVKMINAPVLLVADIDRGGVFASIFGTLALLPEHKKYFKGVIINKFRGDLSLLLPSLKSFEKTIQTPILGVVPYTELNIDDEDSLSRPFKEHVASGCDIDIAVIRLPHISNFTDFAPLERINGVSVRYVSKMCNLACPDMIILPGTKNTLDDLRWLKSCGLFVEIKKFASQGKPVIGICGGYQMMCEKISDLQGVEGGGTEDGLCLLKGVTVFESEKTRTRVKGIFEKIEGFFEFLNGVSFKGYEIHMAKTVSPLLAASILEDSNKIKKTDGLAFKNALGSYVHGLFDEQALAFAIINQICLIKNLPLKKATFIGEKKLKDIEYDKLADVVEKSLDMKKIYEILERGV